MAGDVRLELTHQLPDYSEFSRLVPYQLGLISHI